MEYFKKVSVVGVIGFCALALSACSLYKTPPAQNQGATSSTQTGSQTQSSNTQSAATVTFSDSGVSPATVTVKSGEAITWTNNGSKAVTVASDPHPTHTDNRELTNGQSTIELAPGKSATATLKKVGTWGYHDHLNPSTRGKVVVE